MIDSEIEIDEKILKRLKDRIIDAENNNLKTGKKNATQMVDHIMRMIEEEVKCFSNQ